jgi:allantoin racemase
MMEGKPRVLVIVPVPLDSDGLENRRAQLESLALGPALDFDFRPVRASSAPSHSYHDWLLGDLGVFEAGLEAETEGYSAVCIDTMSDAGMNALRSVLDIPVIGPGRASFLTALMLGSSFSILSLWKPWEGVYRKTLQEYGLQSRCVSIRSLDVEPDLQNLLVGKEDEVFPRLAEAGARCIEDGADVICLGSTSMHQSHAYLASRLPVPVINPGPLTYKLAEAVIALNLTHSRRAYAKPLFPKYAMVHAMLNGAEGL